jgi:tRNA (cytidine/uridine-2'-O-)-methyltransferase
MTQQGPERHVVLVTPEVHWNTGNVGRTCLGAGARLHLIEPLGFSLDCKQVRRAGLDYWPRVDLQVWADFEAFLAGAKPGDGELALFSRCASVSHYAMPRPARQFLVFGSETRGLPDDLRQRYEDAFFRIPITDQIRSLNLSTSVGIVLFESLRSDPKR